MGALARLNRIRRELAEDSGREAPHVYLAGPMRGIPHFNHEAFAHAAAALREAGFEVFSPAEKDSELGIVPPPTGRTPKALRRFPIGSDLKWIAEGDAVFVLEGWEGSEGALLETYVAKYLGIPIYTFPEGKEVTRVLIPV